MATRRIKCSRCAGRGTIADHTGMRSDREHAGLSARAVARHMQVSVQYLCDIERGRRAVNAMIERRFYEALTWLRRA
jgi:predicted transcriptional regulator